MDPNTGAILNTVTLPSTGGAGANGLAFDSFTGKFYVTDDPSDPAARGVYALPTNRFRCNAVGQNNDLHRMAMDICTSLPRKAFLVKYFISTDIVQILDRDS